MKEIYKITLLPLLVLIVIITILNSGCFDNPENNYKESFELHYYLKIETNQEVDTEVRIKIPMNWMNFTDNIEILGGAPTIKADKIDQEDAISIKFTGNITIQVNEILDDARNIHYNYQNEDYIYNKTTKIFCSKSIKTQNVTVKSTFDEYHIETVDGKENKSIHNSMIEGELINGWNYLILNSGAG